MNVDAILRGDGYHMPNPKYKKGSSEPKFIPTDNPAYAEGSTASLFFDAAKRGELSPIGTYDDYKRYIRHGITPKKGELPNDYEKTLSQHQSWLEQGRNSFIQLLSEGGLGTVKAFTDLFDMVTLQWMQDDFDYQNPISSQLEAWQKQIREATPIFQDPDVNLFHGGLASSSFIFNGLPSIISSLTLLIPSKFVTTGVTKGLGWVGRNGMKFARTMEKAHRANQLGREAEEIAEGAETVSKLAKANAFMHGPGGQTAKNIIDYGLGGLTSRLLENYQESRQTYDEGRPMYKQILRNMSEQERQKTIDKLREEFGDDAADWNSYDSISHLIAQKAANETFKDDLWNVGFDIYQMYAIGKVGRGISGPSRSALNRFNKLRIKFPDKTAKELEEMLAKRSKFIKAKDKINDVLFSGWHGVVASLNEGVEEAVNYIAQEEGFHYGKVLLNQEADSSFWSDRLIEYAKAPQLWDSAFWGVVGGVVFNATAEKANQTIQAFDKIKTAKKLAAMQPKDAKNKIPIPTFREAFRSTEITTRREALQSGITKYQTLMTTLDKIEKGEDVFHITSNNKLETEEEKNVAKTRAIQEFRDEVLLNSMDNGNWKLDEAYLKSDELKQSFVDSGHLTKEEADNVQSEILSRGNELRRRYNKHLRHVYNAVAGWGENNDKDLTEIPPEVFHLIVRNNLNRELAVDYYKEAISRLERANATLENDSKAELDEAARTNGITDFKSIIDQVFIAQQLGIVNAEIKDIKSKKEHTTAAGQAVLRHYEQYKKVLEKQLEDALGVNAEKANDVENFVKLLLAQQTAAAVELLPYEKDKQHTYQVNEGSLDYIKLSKAIDNRDRKILEALSPAMKAILDRNPLTGTTEDDFLNQVVSRNKVLNQQYKDLYDNKGNLKVLQNINAQLDANYKQISALRMNMLYEESKKYTTKDQILDAANNYLNDLNLGRATALETASKLYQQLAKRYGKDKIKEELRKYVLEGEHTEVFKQFTSDEQSIFEDYTDLVRLNTPENDLALGDIYRALDLNDIYEFTKAEDVVEIIKDERRKAKEKSSASQNSNGASNNAGSNNISGGPQTSSGQNGNDENEGAGGEEIALGEDEAPDGVVEVEGTPGAASNPFSEENLKGINDEQLASAASTIETYLSRTDISVEDRASAQANLDAVKKEQQRRANPAASSSTGEGSGATNPGLEIDQGDIVVAIRKRVKELEESGNPDNITEEQLKAETKQVIKQVIPTMSDDDIDTLVENSMALVERHLNKKGKSIESSLAGNVMRLSTISSNSRDEAMIKAAKEVLTKSFDELLDIFNAHLSKGKIDGKYVISLEALIRYAKKITNNEYDAQEMYNAFTKIISEHPEKYITIKGNVIQPSQAIANINKTITERKEELDKSVGGRTLNINGILDDLESELRNAKDEDKPAIEKKIKQLKEAVKHLKKGDKVYIRPNFKNKKKRKDGKGYFIGGLDFIIRDGSGTETVISNLPTPMHLGEDSYERGWGEMEDGWFYKFAYDKKDGEFNIQKFFKEVFISDNEHAVEFRKYLKLYESLTQEEAYDEAGTELLNKAWSALEKFIDKTEYNLSDFTQYSTSSEANNHRRLRHLAALDIYTEKNWEFEVENSNFKVSEKKANERNESYKKSIDRWFDKMIESSNTRNVLTKELEALGATDPDNIQTYDLRVEIDNVDAPVLVRTRAENALPAMEALSEESKKDAKLAAGDPNSQNQVVVSKGNPVQLDGASRGRSVVVINDPSGNPTIVPAYPLSFGHVPFTENIKLERFREALEVKLDELMDEWFKTKDSTNLMAFLDSLGHKSKDTRKHGGSLFAGFTRTILETGNGFSIAYKVKKDGTIVSPTSREKGETHYLTFFDTTPIKNKSGKTKARAAVQDFAYGRENNPTVVWNSSTNTQEFANMKILVHKVLLDSLQIRIDPLNINADNTSTMDYGPLMTRDEAGNFALRVPGIKKPTEKLKPYHKDGDVVITELGGTTFSDFILQNNLVRLATRPIDGSNFSVFDHSDGDFGITYKINTEGTSSPVKEINKERTVKSLREEIADIISKTKSDRHNTSKAIIKAILNRIATTDSSLYNLTKNSKIVQQLLHKNVIFVEEFNGATIKYSDGSTDTVPDEAFASYMPSDVEITSNGSTVKVSKGQIIVGTKFMELLDGDVEDMKDALHHILHENVHAFIDDNDTANPEKNKLYKDELTKIWEEYSRKKPDSAHAIGKPNMNLEEFIVESLTNIRLITELNEINADVPLEGPKNPKSLLGKLLHKLVDWLSDILGKDFAINKDSLLSKEYAIFEQEVVSSSSTNNNGSAKTNIPQEGTLNFVEDEPVSVEDDMEESSEDVANFEVTISNPAAAAAEATVEPEKHSRPRRRGSPRYSTISGRFGGVQGALNTMDSENYFAAKRQINNGVLQIKCN